MASKRIEGSLWTSLRPSKSKWRCQHCAKLIRTYSRSMATVVDTPTPTISVDISLPRYSAALKAGFSKPFDLRKRLIRPDIPAHIKTPSVLVTQYGFPTLEPICFRNYPSTHLRLPLRRDLLHRAIVYEGDKHRQGTANTKWRSEVHGSGRKLRPQKGTGRARLGDKKSPMLRGGGVAFGPKPRDMSTGLNKKIYDLAWRTALSYRYRKGELVVVDRVAIDEDDVRAADMPGKTWAEDYVSPTKMKHYVKHVFDTLRWGRVNKGSFVVTLEPSENVDKALQEWIGMGRLRTVDDVDVKNLLEMGWLVVEKEALDYLLFKHQSDLVKSGGMARPLDAPRPAISPDVFAMQRAILDETASMDDVEKAIAAVQVEQELDQSRWKVDEQDLIELDEDEILMEEEVEEEEDVRVSTRLPPKA